MEELNAFGRQLGNPAALVALDEESLLATACEISGLADYGDGRWREGLRVFLRALEAEADLNLLGRIMARNDIVRALVNRLEVRATVAAHPEITAETIEAPLLVVGTGRSGTSLLHELLAQVPGHRVAQTWELLHPCPPPERATYASDPRIAAADQEYTFWHLVAPEYRTMHENGGDVPNEDPLIDMLEFASDHLMGSYPVPSYTRWLSRADAGPVFRAHRQFLQLLQWRCPGERWVLKSPSYLVKLPAFFTEYPDATVVLTHRDPLKVLPSLVSIMATLQQMHSDTVDVDAIVKSAVFGTGIAMDLVMGWRDDGTLPDDRIIDIRFADLVADPVATVRAVMDRSGSTLPADAATRVARYVVDKPRDRHGRHDYTFADTGLDLAETRARFAPYQLRYDVPSEV
ncbi:MAG: sulfotransferase [Acidimicrobiia bacterium]|nr:sulfotransferase [Acidimicrobiia bacterium]